MSAVEAEEAAHFLTQLANMPDEAHFGPPDDLADGVAEVVQLNDEMDAEHNDELQEEAPEPPGDKEGSVDGLGVW
jgi:hypothetical protein